MKGMLVGISQRYYKDINSQRNITCCRIHSRHRNDEAYNSDGLTDGNMEESFANLVRMSANNHNS
jgi:hypothetical protein